MLATLSRLFRRQVCRHEFRNEDLALTGIPKPPDPAPGATREELDRWGDEVIGGKHPWHTERVRWPCAKCGTVFLAHCGLDILAGRGKPSAQSDGREIPPTAPRDLA